MTGTNIIELNSTIEAVASEGETKARDAWNKPVLVPVSAALAELGGSNAIDELGNS
ncbi:MAG TPA: hypothetical protein VGC36_04230 [Rhizomicrobium sp.]